MNLKLIYPQPLRVLIRENLPWIALGVALSLMIWAISGGGLDVHWINAQQLVAKKLVFLAAVLAVIAVRLCYTFLYRASYRYEVFRGRLHIVRGVLLKEEALLPLMPMTELYIRRNWLDLLFGLANLHIAVALERASKIAEIRGLRFRDAVQLRENILDLIEAEQKRVAADASSADQATLVPSLENVEEWDHRPVPTGMPASRRIAMQLATLELGRPNSHPS